MVTSMQPVEKARWVPLELCGKKVGCSLYMVKKIIRIYGS